MHVETCNPACTDLLAGMLVLGLGLGNEGQVLGLGLGFGLVLALKFQGQGLFQGFLKCKSLEKIEVTIKANVPFLCP